ncbi:hypothetical protein D3C75_787910 [compost metagenome]
MIWDLTHKSGDFIFRRIRAILVVMSSVKPSFGPRITVWEVGSSTARLDPPLTGVTNASFIPWTITSARPSRIDVIRSSSV